VVNKKLKTHDTLKKHLQLKTKENFKRIKTKPAETCSKWTFFIDFQGDIKKNHTYIHFKIL
jgi:hypothetical protein